MPIKLTCDACSVDIPVDNTSMKRAYEQARALCDQCYEDRIDVCGEAADWARKQLDHLIEQKIAELMKARRDARMKEIGGRGAYIMAGGGSG